MNNLERFKRTMRFQETDHPPLMLDEPWEDTWARWRSEGYPEGVDLYEYFGLEPLKFEYAGPETGLYPGFEEEIISENGSEIIKKDKYGRIIRDFKDATTMPEWLDFPVKNPEDLREIIDEHFSLQTMEGRWPHDWENKKKRWLLPKRDYGLFLDGGCYYNKLRNLAGMEYASYLFYDSPGLVEELFEKIHLIAMQGLKRVLSEIEVDYLGFGEDIAFKTSTLISPKMFKDYLFPRYKEATDYARKCGVDITWYDSDGDLKPFMELYFECGIDGFAPCEVAAGMEPVLLRENYGKKIKMLGGIDKREISKGVENIEIEVMKKLPVIQKGGYIPKIDHSVSSDISLENYSLYVKMLKGIYSIED